MADPTTPTPVDVRLVGGPAAAPDAPKGPGGGQRLIRAGQLELGRDLPLCYVSNRPPQDGFTEWLTGRARRFTGAVPAWVPVGTPPANIRMVSPRARQLQARKIEIDDRINVALVNAKESIASADGDSRDGLSPSKALHNEIIASIVNDPNLMAQKDEIDRLIEQELGGNARNRMTTIGAVGGAVILGIAALIGGAAVIAVGVGIAAIATGIMRAIGGRQERRNVEEAHTSIDSAPAGAGVSPLGFAGREGRQMHTTEEQIRMATAMAHEITGTAPGTAINPEMMEYAMRKVAEMVDNNSFITGQHVRYGNSESLGFNTAPLPTPAAGGGAGTPSHGPGVFAGKFP